MARLPGSSLLEIALSPQALLIRTPSHMRTSEKAEYANFGWSPLRYVRISQVVAPLRVATP